MDNWIQIQQKTGWLKTKLLVFWNMIFLVFSLIFSITPILAEEGWTSPSGPPPIKLLMPVWDTKEIPVANQTSFQIVQTYVAMFYKFGAMVTGLLAVLMVTVGGAQYALYGVDPGSKENAKTRIKQALLALTLLLLSALILHTVNPAFFTY